MYLKKIEIQGFKSFANKILFEFHNGIMGMTWPTAGKSNVADAVRWVLSAEDQTAAWCQMQDVIFAGTETRKPGLCFGGCYLDNSDHQLAIAYDEATVSRAVYGQEKVNTVSTADICRLKHRGTVLLSKEGYSIIGQAD